MTSQALRWVGKALVNDGVDERRFDLGVDDRVVPGLVWTPTGSVGPRPLVLLAHGATRHKRVDHILEIARRLVRGFGYAAMAIDAPFHGDRRPDPDADELSALADLLVPAPDDWFEAYPVSPRVNRVVDHDAELVRPVADAVP